jgi:hypothetical protein
LFRFRRLLPSLAALVFLALAAAPAAGEAPDESPWVGLAAGRMGDVLWSVKVSRPTPSGRQGPRHPCLQVGTKWELNRYDYQRSRYQGCIDASTHLTATEAPLVVSGGQASSNTSVKLTAVGMIFAPAARRVQVTLDDGNQATIPLQRLSPSQEREVRLGHARYAAFAVRGTWSVARMVSQSRSGRTLWDSAAE